MFLKRVFVLVGLLFVLLLLLNDVATAQSPSGIAVNYIDVTNFPEVRVYATVSDAQGNPITGLNKGNFSLIEGGTPVSIDSISSHLDQMFVVLMLDTTGSMLDPDPSGNLPINILKAAATAFVQNMAPQDVVAVYTFNETQRLRCDFTTDRKVILDCINGINAEQKWTALWDSAYVAVSKAAEIPRGRRAVVLFTDGEDNVSKLHLEDVANKAKESQIPVYTIAAGPEINANDLGRLSLLTNAQSLTSRLSADMPRLFGALSNQLKSQYVLVYTSNAPEGRVDLTVRANVQGATRNVAITFPVPSVQTAISPLVTQIDRTHFPDVQVSVSAPSLPAGVPNPPAVANYLVQEDGSRVVPSGLEETRRGALVQLLVDTSADPSQKGATQRTIWTEEREALLELTDTNTWLDKQGAKDILSFATSKDDPARPNVKFTNDYTQLHNFAYNDKTPPVANVPFDQLVGQGIDAIKNAPFAGDRRMLLIFSNGIPPNADVSKLQVLPDLAKANDISVFVVYFGSSELSAPAENLKKVASLANWRYYWYTSLDVARSVYRQISSFSNQYVIAYRSKISTSGNHRVHVAIRPAEQSSPSQVEVSTENQYSINIAPPQVEVTLPLSSGFVRTANTWNAKPSDAQPTAMNIDYLVKWPDGFPRKVSKITYSFDNGPEHSFNNLSDSGKLDLDITDLDEGTHTLRFSVQDELGLASADKEIQVPIRIVVPGIAQVIRFAVRAFPIGALFLSLAFLVLAIYVYRKRPALVVGAVGTLQKSVKVATDFFQRPKAGERKPAKAYLMPMAGGDTNTGPIPIRSETTRLGRDDSWANIVLQDTSVSRLHAKIVEEQDGGFRIYDEGSKGGTCVNEEEVGISGQWLRDGDLIALGRDEFQFKLKLGPKEATEIFERLGKQQSVKEETDVPSQSVKDKTDYKSAKEDTDVATSVTKEQTSDPLQRGDSSEDLRDDQDKEE